MRISDPRTQQNYLALISHPEEELSNSSINLTNDWKGSLHISPPSFLLCGCWGNLNYIFFILLDYNGLVLVVQCVNVWEQLEWLALVIWDQTLLWSELRTLFVSPPAPSVCITFSPHSHQRGRREEALLRRLHFNILLAEGVYTLYIGLKNKSR